MSDKSKVVWSEGLFLRPQHLQQQERYLERFADQRAEPLRSYPWGMVELEIERELLGIGKFALRRARGVFPDGTPFSMPDHDPLPAALEIGSEARGKAVYLALPLRRAGGAETLRNPAPESFARCSVIEVECRDASVEGSNTIELETGALRSRFLLEGKPLDDFACIPVAEVIECGADKQVMLDASFMPTALNTRACVPLATFTTELVGMLRQHGDALARTVGGAGRGAAAEIADFLKLQTINRFQPLCQHLSRAQLVHPEDLYRVFLVLAGELATLSGKTRRPEDFPDYQHSDLRATFAPVMHALRAYLAMRLAARVVSISVEQVQKNVYSAVIPDVSLARDGTFVLAVGADLSSAQIRQTFPGLTTISAAPRLRELVAGHVPGIAMHTLETVPSQLPFHAGSVYFELDRSSPEWGYLAESGAFGFFVREGFPNLRLEMWAIRN